MREYELSLVVDLSVVEGGGPEASLELLARHVEGRGGRLLGVDHWGRRRMAYPIAGAIDGDYIISRVELDPAAVVELQDALRIDERVYRHLVVRADELPPPPVPREPRRRPEAAGTAVQSPREAEAPTEGAATAAAGTEAPVAVEAPTAMEPPSAADAAEPPDESAAEPAAEPVVQPVGDAPALTAEAAEPLAADDTATVEIGDSPATVEPATKSTE